MVENIVFKLQNFGYQTQPITFLLESLPPSMLLHAGTGSAPQLSLTTNDGSEHTLAVSPKLICLNPWLLMETALNTDTVVVLPNIVTAENVSNGKLERLLPDMHVRRVPIQLAFPSRRLMRPAVRAFIDLAAQVKEMTKYAEDYDVTIAVMGCRVNGPGETDDADLGLWCGPNYVNLKRGPQELGAYPYEEILDRLKEELDTIIAAKA